MGDETRRAPPPPLLPVGHERGDWARIGVELFPHNNVDATELYTCHGGGAQGAALVRERLGTPEHAVEGPIVVVEAALADEVRRLLPEAKVKILTGAAPWEDMSGALGAARVSSSPPDTRSARGAVRCRARRRRPCCGAGRGPWCSRSAAQWGTRPGARAGIGLPGRGRR